MGYAIEKMWARPDRYTAGGNSKQFIAVHNTGSTASAVNEAKNLHNNPGTSSFQYTLDGSSIYQCVHDYDTAWAVGAWKGTTPYIKNDQTISIEVCCPGTEFTDAEKDQLHFLVQDLMAFHGIPASHVVRHWDCHSGRKECPRFYSGAGNSAWDDLHALITSPYAEPAPPKKPLPDGLRGFTDLDSEAWYVQVVLKAYTEGWMNGYDAAHFGPNDALKRGQAVCVVANYSDFEPEELFEDVEASPFYYKALEWAVDEGVVNGQMGEFRPNDPCTRAEFAAMLWNMRGKPDAAVLTGYDGAPEWSRPALDWAVGSKVIGNGSAIRPNDPCTRAEACAMLCNL